MDTEQLRNMINKAIAQDERRSALIREAIELCDEAMDCGVKYLLERCLDGEQAAQSYAAIVQEHTEGWSECESYEDENEAYCIADIGDDVPF